MGGGDTNRWECGRGNGGGVTLTDGSVGGGMGSGIGCDRVGVSSHDVHLHTSQFANVSNYYNCME